ncbi:MAG TPA: isochorismate synthase [Streptosporangiaceae bacterium]|nr:isochorismate synthase [Streptosporangiaceae bacterium]
MRVLSHQETGRLFVRTVAVPDPVDLLAGLPQPDVVAWVQHGAGLAGWGEAVRVSLPAGEDRFTAGEKWLRSVFDAADVDDRVRVRGSGPVAFGSFTFDASSDESVLIVPRAVLGRDGRGLAWLTTVSESGEPAISLPSSPGLLPPAGVRWREGSLPGPRWEQAVAEAVAAIRAGSLRKVVLARDLFATAAEPIDARVLLRRLAARYPDCFTFACDGMVGATPELLVRRAGRQVSALVLGGTAPRGGDPAQDEALGSELLASAKNNEEHAYAVASIRDALGPLCDVLDVEARPGLLKFPNLQHLGTQVRGTLAGGGTPKSALALAAAVHPPAAVCGTPAGAALELLRELEHMDRERYAGPVGWVDADGNGEWGIALRCAQLSGRTARLFAGCGIVAGSEPAAELAETLVKFQPMRDALADTSP